MSTVVFLSGQTRGATLEGIGRSLGRAFEALDISFTEISLIDNAAFLETVKSIDFRNVLLVFSFVSLGMEIPLRREDGTVFDLWQEVGIPFISIHGDSPAYYFDRHIVKSSRFVSVYTFPEHRDLRARLPQIHGLLDTSWPITLDELPKQQMDFRKKQAGRLLFLKNGKDPASLQRFWKSCLEPSSLTAIQAMAAHLEQHLDHSVGNQIDDLVISYFADIGFDILSLTRLRLFFIAQLDDYLRAVKSTRMVELMMSLPVEIRGNNWEHVNFSGKRATYVNECDFTKSTQYIRDSLGLIDMSPNTASHPHDRVMRAYGAHTVCLTNRQDFLSELPNSKRLSFMFADESLPERIEYLLAHRSEAVELGAEVADCYRERHPTEATVRKLLDCASLVRLNCLRQRMPGMQDFFVSSQKLE